MQEIKGLSEIGGVLISEQDILTRVNQMAKEITNDYKDEEADLVLVGILKGAVAFLIDLARKVDLPVKLDFMSVTSYGLNTSSTGDVRVLKDLDNNIEGKNVIIVEDIIDTGFTLDYLIKNFSSKGAKSVKIASLLSKPERRLVHVDIDYLGFEIPDEFVVGYGIDFAEKYRNLPYIGIVKREIYE